jgi:ribose-phosphate pyrophosphokinase
MLLYSLDPGCVLAAALSAQLGQPIARHEERRFEDGECKLRPLSDPRGDDAYVLLGLHGGPVDSPHDKLCRLLMFIATLREHGASRVTALLPYLAYARKDQRTKPFDPVGLRYVAQMFEAVGTEQVIALEVHNVAAFQNAFRCTTLHLDAHSAFDPMLDGLVDGPLAVASPDPGGVKRALLWREALQARRAGAVGFAMVDKRRSGGVVTSANLVAGDVAGATVLLIDDLIASGETLHRAAAALRDKGARRVLAFAAHGLFTGNAADKLADTPFDGVVVTDSVPPWRLRAAGAARARLHVASAAPLFADAVRDAYRAWQRRSCNDDADTAGPTRRNP